MLGRLIGSACVLFVTACGLPANVAVLLPEEDGTVGRAIITTPSGPVTLGGAYAAVGKRAIGSFGPAFVADDADVSREFSDALAATPRKPAVFIVYFMNGQAAIDPKSEADLQVATSAAKSTPNADISVVGHADATGTDAENRALSLARANAIRDILVRAGVSAAIIDVSYFGFSVPLMPTARGVSEPRNRRVEITIR
jgi:outer membrane protein OmpA-like peptidoglycan-associated protein